MHMVPHMLWACKPVFDLTEHGVHGKCPIPTSYMHPIIMLVGAGNYIV